MATFLARGGGTAPAITTETPAASQGRRHFSERQAGPTAGMPDGKDFDRVDGNAVIDVEADASNK